MTASLYPVLLALSLAAPVPKEDRVPTAPAPRPLIQFRALHFNNAPEVASLRTVGVAEFDSAGPIERTVAVVPKMINQVAYDPTSKVLYGISPQKVFVVAPGQADKGLLTELLVPAELTALRAPSGIAFDSKRERVVIAGLGGKGRMYAYTPKTGKWAELADTTGARVAALTYSARTDELYGVYEAPGGQVPTIGIFDPATGKLKDEIALVDPGLPKDFGKARRGQTTIQLAAVGNHLILLTKRQMFRFELKTSKITVEWKK